MNNELEDELGEIFETIYQMGRSDEKYEWEDWKNLKAGVTLKATKLISKREIEARISELKEVAEDMVAQDNYHEHNDSVALHLKKKWNDRLNQLTELQEGKE